MGIILKVDYICELIENMVHYTHLPENAVDIWFIQELPGHSSIKTTERYTLSANLVQTKIKSPLDKLDFNSRNSDKNKPL